MQKITLLKLLKKDDIHIWISGFIALCLSFSPLLFNFIWGNHDWLPLITDSNFSSGLIEGRFSQFILLVLFLTGKILPILNIFIGFACYTLAILILCRKFYDFTASKTVITLFLISTILLPYTIEPLYFHFITLSLLSWPLFIVFALISAKHAETSNTIPYTILSTIFLFISIGGYPPCINMFIVATLCRFILNINNYHNSLKLLLKQAIPYTISILISLILLKYSYSYLQNHHRMMALYNNNLNTPMELLQKIPHIWYITIASLIQPQPFFSLLYKELTTLLVLWFTIRFLFSTFKIKALLLNISFLALLLLGLKFTAWLAKPDINNVFSTTDPADFMVRADFYSIPAFLLFCLIYIYKNSLKWHKNLSYIISLTLILVCVNSNLDFTKTHLLGFTAENKLLERIISRIQDNPNFNSQNYYTVVQAGELPLRQRYYQQHPLEKYGYYTLQVPYSRHWIAKEYYNFYAPEEFVRDGTSIYPENITPTMISFLTNKISSWPAPTSTYIDEQHAIIALTPEGKTMLTEQFKLLQEYIQ